MLTCQYPLVEISPNTPYWQSTVRSLYVLFDYSNCCIFVCREPLWCPILLLCCLTRTNGKLLTPLTPNISWMLKESLWRETHFYLFLQVTFTQNDLSIATYIMSVYIIIYFHLHLCLFFQESVHVWGRAWQEWSSSCFLLVCFRSLTFPPWMELCWVQKESLEQHARHIPLRSMLKPAEHCKLSFMLKKPKLLKAFIGIHT